MARPFVPVFIVGVELIIEIDQVIIEVVVEVVIIVVEVVIIIVFVVEIVFVVQIVFVVFVVEIVFVVEEVIVIVIIEIVVFYDLVLRIVTVCGTSRSVAFREPHHLVAFHCEFLSRRLESVQHTITFLRVREAPARVSLRVTASSDRSR